MVITFKYRVKDRKRSKQLRNAAWRVNQVWNFCVELQRRYHETWFSHFDLVNATKMVGKDVGVHSDTRSAICKQFAQSRDQHKKIPAFRKSGGSKRSLGWVPGIPRAFSIDGDSIMYQKVRYRFVKHRDMPGKIRTCAIVEDALGKWYVTFTGDVADLPQAPDSAVGIDLGLKDMATMSNGEKIEAQRIYRKYEERLALAQRANNKKRVRAIHAKIRNSRHHFNHVNSCRIARSHRTVVVGDVSASKLAKTKMAKSVLDAGWSQFRAQLDYKVRRHQGVFVRVNEAFTTQACSACGSLPPSRPKGIAGLRVREWECSCGVIHDRDVNAAINILTLGLETQPPVVESPRL